MGQSIRALPLVVLLFSLCLGTNSLSTMYNRGEIYLQFLTKLPEPEVFHGDPGAHRPSWVLHGRGPQPLSHRPVWVHGRLRTEPLSRRGGQVSEQSLRRVFSKCGV